MCFSIFEKTARTIHTLSKSLQTFNVYPIPINRKYHNWISAPHLYNPSQAPDNPIIYTRSKSDAHKRWSISYNISNRSNSFAIGNTGTLPVVVYTQQLRLQPHQNSQIWRSVTQQVLYLVLLNSSQYSTNQTCRMQTRCSRNFALGVRIAFDTSCIAHVHSAVNAIDTQLRDLINWGLARSMFTVKWTPSRKAGGFQ